MYVNSYGSFCCQLIVCVSCYSIIHARAVSVAINVCSFCYMCALYLVYICIILAAEDNTYAATMPLSCCGVHEHESYNII